MFGPYNPCPAHPNGTPWEVKMRSRYASCCWNMKTFNDALNYLRQQYAYAVRDTKAKRRPGDEYCEMEFQGYIDGPGGRLEWHDIEKLVKKR